MGQPEADIIWTKVGSVTQVATGATLALDPVELSDNGEYVCRPTNSLGDGDPATHTLTVNGEAWYTVLWAVFNILIT